MRLSEIKLPSTSSSSCEVCGAFSLLAKVESSLSLELERLRDLEFFEVVITVEVEDDNFLSSEVTMFDTRTASSKFSIVVVDSFLTE